MGLVVEFVHRMVISTRRIADALPILESSDDYSSFSAAVALELWR